MQKNNYLLPLFFLLFYCSGMVQAQFKLPKVKKSTAKKSTQKTASASNPELDKAIYNLNYLKGNIESEFKRENATTASIIDRLDKFEAKLKQRKSEFPKHDFSEFDTFLSQSRTKCDNKTGTKAKAAVKTAPSSSSTTASNNPEMEKVIYNLNYLKRNIESEFRQKEPSYNRIVDGLDGFETKLKQRKFEYPDYDFSEFDTFLSETRTKHKEESSAKNKTADIKYTLRRMKEAKDLMLRGRDMTGSGLAYQRFVEYKQKYKEDGKPNLETNQHIEALNKFYDSEFDANFTAFKFYEKAFKEKEEWDKTWREKPEYVRKNMDSYIKGLDVIRKIPKDPNVSYSKFIGEFTTLRAKVDTYIESGEYEKHLADKYEELLRSRKMPVKGKMHSSDFVNIIKRDFPKIADGNTLVKVTITSNSLQIDRNIFEQPITRYIYASLLVKDKDGGCVIKSVSVYGEFDGVKYAPYATSQMSTAYRLHCDNTH